MVLFALLLATAIDLHFFFYILYKRTNLKIQSTIFALITFILLTIYWFVAKSNADGGLLAGFFEHLCMLNSFISAIIWFVALIKTTKNDYYIETTKTIDNKSKILLYSFIANLLLTLLVSLANYLMLDEPLYALSPLGMWMLFGPAITAYKILIYLKIVLFVCQFIFFVISDNKELKNKNVEKEME